jgi:transposase
MKAKTKKYPCDITREQFESIREILESARKNTRPRNVDLYEVFNAVLYLLKSGCQWRMLPTEYPKWKTVYHYFNIRREEKGIIQKSILNECLKKIGWRGSYKTGSEIENELFNRWRSEREKHWLCWAEGIWWRKKISGIKRHIAVDTNGLPHAIHITTANVTDRNGIIEAFQMNKPNLINVKKVLADGGYAGDKFAEETQKMIDAEVQIAKRNELHTFKVIPKRWVVERSFAWLQKCRRLWKNTERKLKTSLNMVYLAFIALLLKRF